MLLPSCAALLDIALTPETRYAGSFKIYGNCLQVRKSKPGVVLRIASTQTAATPEVDMQTCWKRQGVQKPAHDLSKLRCGVVYLVGPLASDHGVTESDCHDSCTPAVVPM
jgi:hypothetical protein